MIFKDINTRRVLIVLAMLLAFFDGTLAFIFPVLFPVFKARYHCTTEQLGRIQFIYSMCELAYCFAAIWIANRWGFVKMLLGGLLISVCGLVIIGGSHSYGGLLAGTIVLGLSEAVYFALGSTIITNCFRQLQSTYFFLFGVVLSSGSIITSYGLGKWIDYSEKVSAYWGAGIWAIAVFILVIAMLVLAARNNIKAIDNVNFNKEIRILAVYKDLLKQRNILKMGTALMLYAVAYISILSWIGQLYQKKFNIDAGQSASIISLYLIGFLIGRIIFYFVIRKTNISPLVIILICASGSTLTLGLSIGASGLLFGEIMVLLSGITLSANVPAITSEMGALFEADNSFPAYVFTMEVFSVSYGFGPYFIALLGSILSLGISIWIAPLFSLLLGIIAFSNIRADKKLIPYKIADRA